MTTITARALLLVTILSLSVQAPLAAAQAGDTVCDLGILGPAFCPLPAVLSETVQVGELGASDGMPYALAEGGLVVSPGARVTFVAEWSFEQAVVASGYTYGIAARVDIHGPNGLLGSDIVSRTTSMGAFSDADTLEVTLSVPENFRGGSVVLKVDAWRYNSTSNTLLGQAQSTAPLTTVAVPDPVVFLTEDLQSGAVFDAGTISITAAALELAPTDGATFVSTELGALARATAVVDRPALQGLAYFWMNTAVSMSVSIEGGASYWVSRTVFADSCNDWAGNSCSASGETRTVDLEIALPASAVDGRSVANVHLLAHHSLEGYDAVNGEWVSNWVAEAATGRNVFVAGGV